MLARCFNPKTKGYEGYGGRGITVCERWRFSFENFLADMGKRPSAVHSIDRVDNNGNYEPTNCQWRTEKEQQNNKRDCRYITYQGQTKTLTEWSEHYGFKRGVIAGRLALGWTLEQAFSLPSGVRRLAEMPWAKLTVAEVIAIRSDSRSQKAIAQHYGIGQSAISYVKSRKAWRHVL